MPFVTVRIIKGQPQERKNEMAERIAGAISDITGLPESAVWTVFEDVEADQWYVGADTVKSLREARE